MPPIVRQGGYVTHALTNRYNGNWAQHHSLRSIGEIALTNERSWLRGQRRACRGGSPGVSSFSRQFSPLGGGALFPVPLGHLLER